MCIFLTTLCIIGLQVTQQVYVTEEWVRNSNDQINAEAHSHLEVEKSLGALKEEHTRLSEKLKDLDKVRLSVEAGLKTMAKQMEDQRKKLHLTEINLAIEKQTVLDLKAELEKEREATRVAREAAEATVSALTYLAEEVAIVCRDYVLESQGVAMDRVGVPTESQLRRLENIFFPEDI